MATWKAELIEAGHQRWLEARANGYREIAPECRCPLVNPLCPDDLCVLEAGHPGAKQGYHILGTDPYDAPYQYIRKGSHFRMLEPGATDAELMELGWELREALFGD